MMDHREPWNSQKPASNPPQFGGGMAGRDPMNHVEDRPMWVRLEFDRLALPLGLLAIIGTYLAIDRPPEIVVRAGLDPVPSYSADLTQRVFGYVNDRLSLPALRRAPSP